MATKGVEVEIFGQRYRLRGEGAEGYIKEVASFVDRKMREMAERTPSVSTLHIAILAALNIADECLKSKKGSEELLRKIKTQRKRLEEFIASEMKE